MTNTGSVDATSITGAMSALPFRYAVSGNYPGGSGTCGAMLAPGISCTVEVEYLPTANVVSNENFTLNYNDGSIGQSPVSYTHLTLPTICSV